LKLCRHLFSFYSRAGKADSIGKGSSSSLGRRSCADILWQCSENASRNNTYHLSDSGVTVTNHSASEGPVARHYSATLQPEEQTASAVPQKQSGQTKFVRAEKINLDDRDLETEISLAFRACQ
jgi:hypothetical protein